MHVSVLFGRNSIRATHTDTVGFGCLTHMLCVQDCMLCVCMFAELPGRGAAEADGKGSTATSPTDGLTSRQRRMRAAAGVFELSQASFADVPDSCQADDADKQQQQAGMSGSSAQPDPLSVGECSGHWSAEWS